MPSYSATCQKIKTQLDALKSEKTSLQAELQEAAPGAKSALTGQIKALIPRITAKQKELDECVKKHPYVPPKPPKQNPCLSFQKEVDKLVAALRKEIRDAVAPLQAELHEASPSQKVAIIAEIKKTREQIKKNSPTTRKIAEARAANNKCIIDEGGKLALQATFNGTATMTTSNSDAPGPFKQKVTIGLFFSDWDRRNVSITSFPTIKVGPFDTPVGDVTTTVSYIGGEGTFVAATNRLSIRLSLFFHHSTDFAGDSRLNIELHTTSALNEKGQITVGGSAVFKEGFLGDDTCWMTVQGTIDPHP